MIEVHERVHRSLQELVEHCGDLGPGDLNRELPGFGYPTVRLQLHHVIGAEEYWVGVLQGRVEADENDAAYPTTAALEAYRRRVGTATAAYLGAVAAEELNTPRPMRTWGGRERVLVPAHVILRTMMHVYHHLGQVAAMCRLLGRPTEGRDLNYPTA
ncbi:MAG: DinB family protein [Planctomycetota bacterium]